MATADASNDLDQLETRAGAAGLDRAADWPA
jgi:hypothetical protein